MKNTFLTFLTAITSVAAISSCNSDSAYSHLSQADRDFVNTKGRVIKNAVLSSQSKISEEVHFYAIGRDKPVSFKYADSVTTAEIGKIQKLFPEVSVTKDSILKNDKGEAYDRNRELSVTIPGSKTVFPIAQFN